MADLSDAHPAIPPNPSGPRLGRLSPIAGRAFIIAEIGVNHDGDLSRAADLIQAAAAAGADAVKFQLFHPDRLLSNQAVLASYQSDLDQPQAAKSIHDLLANLTLQPESLIQLSELARGLGMRFIVTPFSLGDVDDLNALIEVHGAPLDAVKIASPDAVNLPLITAALTLDLPLIISTGTCTLDELDQLTPLLTQAPVALLHCVSAYPTPLDQAALRGIESLRQHTGLPSGYSDHTSAVHTGALAVALGACVLEKHLTWNQAAPGPDHAASLDPEGFAQYVSLTRQAERMLGPATKRPGLIEADVRRVSRQSVCATRDLPAGHVLETSDLTPKRPGTGIPAAELPRLIGRTLRTAVAANDLLTRDSVEPA